MKGCRACPHAAPFQHAGDDMGGMVISGGRVVDPASGMDAIGDVALLDGKVAALGTGLGGAEQVIDATGLVVAPGFIDLHAHGQSIPADRMQACDGVTTTLDLEAGVMPVGSWYRRQADHGRVLNYGASHELGLRPHRRDDRLQRGIVAGGVRPGHAGPALGEERRHRGGAGRHPGPHRPRAGRGRHRHRHPQRLRARRRRAGADGGVPAGLRAGRADRSPTSPTCRASIRKARRRRMSA